MRERKVRRHQSVHVLCCTCKSWCMIHPKQTWMWSTLGLIHIKHQWQIKLDMCLLCWFNDYPEVLRKLTDVICQPQFHAQNYLRRSRTAILKLYIGKEFPLPIHVLATVHMSVGASVPQTHHRSSLALRLIVTCTWSPPSKHTPGKIDSRIALQNNRGSRDADSISCSDT